MSRGQWSEKDAPEIDDDDDGGTLVGDLVVKPIPLPPRLSLEERRRLAAVELERLTGSRTAIYGEPMTPDQIEAAKQEKKKQTTPAPWMARRGRGKSITYAQKI